MSAAFGGRPAHDLTSLLRPVEPEAFFGDYWERQPLVVERNDPAHYRDLFRLDDVEELLAFTRPKFTDADAFRPGAPPRNYVQGLLPDDDSSGATYPNVREVYRAFERGRTLILTALDQRCGPVAALCRRLAALFCCPVNTNLYLTPPGAQGFDPHWDTHEVFVLQVEGHKHWRLYGAQRELPLAHEYGTVARDQLGPPTREAVLRPGDLLYLPRGHVHEAFTSETLSLHLTVGVKVLRWADLLRQALDAVSVRDARLRAALPPGLLTADAVPPEVRETFAELVRAVAAGAGVEEAVGRQAAGFLSQLPALPAGSFSAPAADAPGPDTVLERVPGMIGRVAALADGRVQLQFAGGALEGPPKIAGALRFLLRAPQFTARQMPDDLTLDGRLVLLRRLLRDGFLRVVPGVGTPVAG